MWQWLLGVLLVQSEHCLLQVLSVRRLESEAHNTSLDGLEGAMK
jgi:hypothetical protein